jgi:hypothetical protein
VNLGVEAVKIDSINAFYIPRDPTDMGLRYCDIEVEDTNNAEIEHPSALRNGIHMSMDNYDLSPPTAAPLLSCQVCRISVDTQGREPK